MANFGGCAKDVEGALAYVADDVVLAILPGTDSFFVGKEALRPWWTFLANDNATFEFTEFTVQGEKVTWSAKSSGDTFDDLNIPVIEFDGVGIVRNGLMQGNIWTFREASLAWIDSATTLATNKEVIRTYMAAWDEGDAATLDEIFAEDFVNHSPPLPADRDGMIQAAVEESEAFSGDVWTIEQIVAEGDLVSVFLQFNGVHDGGDFIGIPATGAEISFTGTLIFRLEDGQITDRWGNAAELDLLTPLGFELMPPSPDN